MRMNVFTPRLVAPVICIALAVATPAAARSDARTMTCAQIQALLDRQGAAILTTGANTYGRYISRNGRACTLGQVSVRSTVPARDGACPVLRCQQFDLSPK